MTAVFCLLVFLHTTSWKMCVCENVLVAQGSMKGSKYMKIKYTNI